MIDGQKFFVHPVKNYLRAYDNIRKIATGQGDDYTNGFLLDYPYIRKHCKIIAIELSKQYALDANPRAMQQSNFTGNLDENVNITMFFVIEEAKETILDFLRGTLRVL